MKIRLIIFAVLFLYISASAQTRDLTGWVDPFIGTGGHGHTFPGAVVPFGMVQLSPDTRADNWDGSSGYHYSDDVIYGFSHTHLSGTGIPDGCDILFMPLAGEPQFFAKQGDRSVNGYASKFSHANEKAEPGYYSVRLEDDDINAEMTTTKRVGFHRYRFGKSETATVIVDLTWRDKLLDGELTVNGNRVEGYRSSSSWARNQVVYFVAEFSLPIRETKFGPEMLGIRDGKIVSSKLKPMQAGLRFDSKAGVPLLVKVAISNVSIEGARKNLAAELPGWDFDKVRAEAKAAWNKELSKIEVSGGTPEQTKTFYTALYHTMIHPSLFSDVDGNYRGLDGKVHNTADEAGSVSRAAKNSPRYQGGVSGSSSPPGLRRGSDASSAGWSADRVVLSAPANGKENGSKTVARGEPPRREDTASLLGKEGSLKRTQNASDQYTVFSLWDTFRAAHPLYTIIQQKRTADFINTFIRMYEQGGRLPVWELWGNETDTMIGYHAVPVIADAMAKGIKGFDYEKAYEAAKHSAELNHYGLAAYKKRGYISMEDENESVSKTLEYAYDDWCIMSMGSMLFNRRSLGQGKDLGADNDPYLKKLSQDIDHYRRRAGNFENLFDKETGFFRPRQNGGFVKPFAPQEVTFHFTEGNAWQYSFFVPHDVSRLIQLMGGTERFIGKLDELFTTETKLSGREQPDITGLIGQYAHGNEPSHHIAYLYDYAHVPSKTQKRVRQIMDDFYKPTPDGLIGNEDCGQMSAWYVLSASGFYPVVPGTSRYDLGAPLFKQVTYHLENGKTFVIKAPNVSPANIYIKSAKWNGGPQWTPYIVQEQIMAGGVLALEMSDKPNDNAFEAVSTSSVFQDQEPVPVIDGGPRVFDTSTNVALRSTVPRAVIRYTIDGSVPGNDSPVYTAPFRIDKTTTVKAVGFLDGSMPSLVAEATFHKKPNDWTVKLFSQYNRQYTGGGDLGLIDGIMGTTNFASGEWQGYQGQDFVAVVDLQRPTEIHELGGGFLQVARSWIWMPTRIEFEVSDDNTTWHKTLDFKTDVAPEDMTPTIREYRFEVAPTTARYVRIRAHNLGKIPSWHAGAGGDAFIFVDEIFIK